MHRGESQQYKLDAGESCGAPCQNHYDFSTGQKVTDNEFPLGKRVFPSKY